MSTKTYEFTGDITGVLDLDTHELVISGSGQIPDYTTSTYLAKSDTNFKAITSVVIEYGITRIGAYTFYYCNKLTSIQLPESLTTIGNNAFYNATSLTSITFPSSLTTIGNYAFQYTKLGTVTIPKSVMSLGDYCFRNCTSLNSVLFEADSILTTIPTYAFASCTSLGTIALPDKVIAINGNAFASCSSLTSVTFNPEQMTIYASAFLNCTELVSIPSLENSASVGTSAFKNCSKLQDVYLPVKADAIGTYAFQNCTSIKSIIIPATYTKIPQYAFAGCSSLSDVTFRGNLITIINQYAFDGTAISNLTIPYGVTDIAGYAFGDNSSLLKVSIPETTTTIVSTAFSNCSNLAEISIDAEEDSVANSPWGATNAKVIWEQSTGFSVRFLDYDGKVLLSVRVEEGQSATPPSNPQRTGYKFMGWEGDYTNIQTDTDITATYEICTYHIRYYGFEDALLKEEDVEYGQSLNPPVIPAVAGYLYTGWNPALDTTILKDTDFYATYEAIIYTVVFKDYDETVLSTQELKYGEDAVPPDIPVHEGKTFINWDGDYTNITQDKVITAIFIDNWTVKFLDYNNSIISEQSIPNGEDAILPTTVPARNAYTFTGWSGDYTNVTSDRFIYAQYTFNGSKIKDLIDKGCTKYIYISIPELDITLEGKSIKSESMTITQSICEDDQLAFGKCNASEFTIDVLDKSIDYIGKTVYVTMQFTGYDEIFSLGKYYITSSKKSSNKGYRTLTGYDDLYKVLKEDMTNWYERQFFNQAESNYPTIKELRTRFFEYFNIEVQEHDLPLDDLRLKPTSRTVVTGKDIIEGICEVNGCFGTIGFDGKFRYVFLGNEENYNIEKGKFWSFESEEYQVKPINQVEIIGEDDATATFSDGTFEYGENRYVVRDNMIINGYTGEEIFEIAETMYTQVSTIEYTPISYSGTGMVWANVGDSLSVTDVDGTEVSSYILNRSLSGITSLNDEVTSSGNETYETDNNSTTSKANTAYKLATQTSTKGLFKVESVDKLPEETDPNTIYLIRGTAVVN
jgi:hypothetical protein